MNHDGGGVSSSFIRALRLIDPDLRACFDEVQDAIIIWAERQGHPKIHEYTSKRTFTEESSFVGRDGNKILKKVVLGRYDLECWTLKRLREIDVWQRFGKNGEKFEDFLYAQEEAAKAEAKKKFHSDRKAYLKEHKKEFKEALENAKSGHLFETPDHLLTERQRAKKPKTQRES